MAKRSELVGLLPKIFSLVNNNKLVFRAYLLSSKDILLFSLFALKNQKPNQYANYIKIIKSLT